MKRTATKDVWYLRYELPKLSGERQRRSEKFRGTKAEADRRMRDILREVENGEIGDVRKLTIAGVATEWLATTKQRVGEKTYRAYSAHIRLYITPTIGSVKAQALRAPHVEKALNSWAQGARNDREKGALSQRTVAHIFNTLRTLCRWAVRVGYLSRSPMDAVQSPRVDRIEMRALIPSEVTELLSAAKGTDLETVIRVAVGTGLRRGELLGLKWSDVDFDRSRLSVRRSIEMRDGKRYAKPPKTTRSARKISLPAFVVDCLRDRLAEQTRRTAFLGLGKSNADTWVFTRAAEEP